MISYTLQLDLVIKEMKMNRDAYTYAYGFIAGVLLAAFVSVLAYAVCDYYCDHMLDDLLSKGAVIVVPDGVINSLH